MSKPFRFTRRSLLFAAGVVLSGATTLAQGQRPQTSARATWTFNITAGGFIVGNGHAVTGWLRRNAYDAPVGPICVLNSLLARICSPPEPYPKMAHRSLLAGTASVARNFRERLAVEVFAATEQSGTATGHCDIATRDVRCVDQYMDVDFSGGSFASLVAYDLPHVRLGVGPAVLFANWRMEPAHLPGLWFDARSSIKSSPWIVRAQYRLYRSVTQSPQRGFSGFHPSTLFLGLGFVTTSNTPP